MSSSSRSLGCVLIGTLCWLCLYWNEISLEESQEELYKTDSFNETCSEGTGSFPKHVASRPRRIYIPASSGRWWVRKLAYVFCPFLKNKHKHSRYSIVSKDEYITKASVGGTDEIFSGRFLFSCLDLDSTFFTLFCSFIKIERERETGRKNKICVIRECCTGHVDYSYPLFWTRTSSNVIETWLTYNAKVAYFSETRECTRRTRGWSSNRVFT